MFRIGDKQVGIIVCEDFWRALDVEAGTHLAPEHRRNPAKEMAESGCELLLIPSASPFVLGKGERHLAQLQRVASELKMTLCLVNQVGGNNDLIFDGRSALVDPNGNVRAMCKPFCDDLVVVDLEGEHETPVISFDPMQELFDALVLGIRDYVGKTGHKSVLIGLSGGIDSALTAVLAAAAISSENVVGAMMPSEYSSTGSIEDAEALAENLDITQLHTVSIQDVHSAVRTTVAGMLGKNAPGVVDENIQARLRGMILMAISNATPGSLVLATGNKSELATGYCTLYGDMCGALAVLGDVLKSQVYELSRWINTNHTACGFDVPPIPESTITKPPSAELRPDQTDQDTLPPYEVLDSIIHRFIDLEQDVDTIAYETGYDISLVKKMARMIDINEYKRMQAAIVLKISPRAFGPGRPMPVAMRLNLDCRD